MEQNRRSLILHKYTENPKWSYSLIASSLKISKSTVRDVLNRYKTTLTVNRAEGSGSKKGPRDQHLAKKIVRSAVKYPNLSLRERARKYGTSHTGVKRGLASEGYRSFSVIKAPNRNEKASRSAKTRMRKLYDNVIKNYTGCILMDDETYQYINTSQTPGRKFYSAKGRLLLNSQSISLSRWTNLARNSLFGKPFVAVG